MPNLLSHVIELRPTAEQAVFLRKSMGANRYAYNQLLGHFSQPGVKWSKKAGQEYFYAQVQQPWMSEVSARAPRHAVLDLHRAFVNFFDRCQKGIKPPGYPKFHRKGVNDSFSMRESSRFTVVGRTLRLEKCPGRIKMREKLRFSGKTKQVTISLHAGKFYASILVETEDYSTTAGTGTVGVDFGIKNLAVTSDGDIHPANQKLKANLKRLKRRQRRFSRAQKGSKRRLKAKARLARLHKRIADQRKAVLHELSDKLTKTYKTIVIEDLNVKGMVKNRKLARAISDAGFGMLRRFIEYKSELRGCEAILANRFFPSSKMCSSCGEIKKDLKLSDRTYCCSACGFEIDRDLNAALNLKNLGDQKRLHTFEADDKRTQETCQTGKLSEPALSLTV